MRLKYWRRCLLYLSLITPLILHIPLRAPATQVGTTSFGPPQYAEVKFSSITGEIFVNPEYTGRLSTGRTLLKTGLPRAKADIQLGKSIDGWGKVVVSQSESEATDLIITGEKGSLKISLSERGSAGQPEKVESLNELVIGFGRLDTTLLTPMTISEPAGFAVEILDPQKDEFISGDVIAIKENEIAVKFENLSPTVINDQGFIRVSVKESGDRFLNADLKAWGYNILIPDADAEKESFIRAKVFGLPKEAKVRFSFQPIPRQKITPSTKILTVEEINSGKPLAAILSSIPGAQPIIVSAEAVYQ